MHTAAQMLLVYITRYINRDINKDINREQGHVGSGSQVAENSVALSTKVK